MYILNITRATSKMMLNELRNFIHKNYYKPVGFKKEDAYYSLKQQKKRVTTICNQFNKKYLILIILKKINPSYLNKKSKNFW